MGIQFDLLPGTIVRCDYSRGGFQAPEMVKARPAVIVSPRLRHRDGLCSVVPLSSDPGTHEVPYVVKLDLDPPLPEPFGYQTVWAKCDMLATIGFARLDMFRTARDQYGRRKYLQPHLPNADLLRIRNGIAAALGLPTIKGSLTLVAE